MQHVQSPSVLVVQTPAAARILLNPDCLTYLEPFLAQSQTITAAAKQIGCKPNTLLGWVQRLLKAGLLRVDYQARRTGRSIKHYRSSADSFFVPIALHDILDGHQDWFKRLSGQVETGLRFGYQTSPGLGGSRVYRNAKGEVSVSFAVDPDTDYDSLQEGEPALLTVSHDALHLDYPQAKALQRELFALLQRYREFEGGQQYLLWLNLVPLPASEASAPSRPPA